MSQEKENTVFTEASEERSSKHEDSTNLQVISIHTSSNKIHKTELKYHRRMKGILSIP